MGFLSDDGFKTAEANKITVPKSTAKFNRPTRDKVGALTLDLNTGKAPSLRAQSQQQIGGEDIQRLVKATGQIEATTGRELTGALTAGLSKSAFGAAADRAAQNKSLALQEFGLELQKFGLDSDNTFKTASILLTKQGADRTFALNKFAQDLQASGMELDQSFRVAQQAINVQVVNESNRIQREAIAAGVEINQANAKAAGIGALANLGVTAAVVFSERALKDHIVSFASAEHSDNLEQVKRLPLYHFQYIGDNEKMIGAMTDEMPEDIKTSDGRMVNLYSLNTMLLSAVKSLLSRVEELEGSHGVS